MPAAIRLQIKAWLLIAISSLVQARRIQQKTPTSYRHTAEPLAELRIKSPKAFAMLLVALNPSSAFAHPSSRMCSPICKSTPKSCGKVRLNRQVISCRRSGDVHLDSSADLKHPKEPQIKVLPCGDALDKQIWQQTKFCTLNILVLPMQGLIDLFFIGKLGTPLAMAGQAVANQVYSTVGLLSSTLPSVTTGLVAAAHASGNQEEVQRQVGGAIFLSVVFGALISFIVALFSSNFLLAMGSSSALSFSLPYLLWRLPGVIPETASTVSASSLQGTFDSKTPLKVSILALMTNAVFNYLLMFQAGMGIAGAGLATAVAQLVSGATYFAILAKRKMVPRVLRPPSREWLQTLGKSMGALQARQIALNVAFIAITKQTQTLDTTGVAAAAQGVAVQTWLLGGSMLLALSTVANVVTSAELGKKESSPEAARTVAKRVLVWAAMLSGLTGAAQLLVGCFAWTPLVSLFTTNPEVQVAARMPFLIGSMLQVINGLVFAGEGLMVAGKAFKMLATGQVLATILFCLGIQLTPSSLNNLWMCFWIFNAVRLANFVKFFWYSKSPLLPEGRRKH